VCAWHKDVRSLSSREISTLNGIKPEKKSLLEKKPNTPNSSVEGCCVLQYISISEDHNKNHSLHHGVLLYIFPMHSKIAHSYQNKPKTEQRELSEDGRNAQ